MNSSVIYAVEDDRGVKIGVSAQLKYRFSQLAVSRVGEMRIIGTRPGERADEQDIHGKLRKWNIEDLGLEWFRKEGKVLDFLATLEPYIGPSVAADRPTRLAVKSPRTGRPKKPDALPHYVAHVKIPPELGPRLEEERLRFHTRGVADTIRALLTETLGFYTDVIRVLRVPILSWEQDRWLASEQHRLGCATRTDAVRAILDEARARG